MVSSTLFDWVFRGVNTIAIIGVLIYLYKRYGLPVITQQMEHEHKREADLAAHAQTLQELAKQVQAEVAQDEQFFAGMKERIILWKKNIEIKQSQIDHAMHLRRAYQDEQNKKRAAYLRDSYLKRQVIPHAMHQVRHDLVLAAQSGNLEQRVMETVLAHMKAVKS